MNQERMQILAMLKDGKISAEEADQLLAALEEPAPDPGGPALAPAKNLKYLRVLVEPQNGSRSKKDRVNIKVPLALLRAGMKMTSLLPDDARDKIERTMSEKGISLGDLTAENLEVFIQALGEMSIDIEAEDKNIKIYCE